MPLNIESIKTRKINNWEIDYCNMSGSLSWVNEEFDFVIYATPNWDNEDKVPINLTNEGGDSVEIGEFNLLGSEDEKEKQYIGYIKAIIGMADQDIIGIYK